MGAMPPLPSPIVGAPDATWRALSVEDAPAYARLHEAARAADAGEEVMTDEYAERHLTDPNAPPATNTLALAASDGTLLASILVHQRLAGRTAHRVFLWGVTHPGHRGRGIGTALVRWGVARAEEVLGSRPDGLPGIVEVFKDVRLTDAVALHEAAGFLPVRWYTEMRRDLREPFPSMPDLGSIEVRHYDPTLSEEVRLAHNEAFADHWGSEPIERAAWERDFVGDPSFRVDLSFVALDGATVAGYTVNYVAEADWLVTGIREGWVGQIGVRRPWRGRGLATALLVGSMRAFATAGMDAAILGVDTENPTGAVGVYERVGFRPVRRSVRMQRPFEPAPVSLFEPAPARV